MDTSHTSKCKLHKKNKICKKKNKFVKFVLKLKYYTILNSLYNVVESFTVGLQIPLCL